MNRCRREKVHKTGIMIEIITHTTEDNQRLLLNITYSCVIRNGVAKYKGKVECRIEPLAPFDPGYSAIGEFRFSRDAYWNAMSNGTICLEEGAENLSLSEILISVARAIMEYEEGMN
jgi:hypothetical protein